MQAHPIRIGRHVINVNDDQPTFWAKVAADRWEVGTLAAIDQVVREPTREVRRLLTPVAEEDASSFGCAHPHLRDGVPPPRVGGQPPPIGSLSGYVAYLY